MKDIVLPDTSLCAIVRDEVMNPAGGILRFLRSVMPHVEEGVVVDTGSVDRTRELLEESEKDFPNLRIYDTSFGGYAEARNFSLKHVRTKRALVLDADEIIKQEDYIPLQKLIENTGISFEFINVSPTGPSSGDGHNERFFHTDANPCFGNYFPWSGEYLDLDLVSSSTNVPIYHFLPTIDALNNKQRQWYSRNLPSGAPSQTPGFTEWKKFNPLRNDYKASNLDAPQEVQPIS